MSPDPSVLHSMIPVAPREIVDLVNRILRVNGVDAGASAEIATGVMRCAADGQAAIGHVLACIADGSIATLAAPHDDRQLSPERNSAAMRNGIPVAEADFRALERAAAAFLVAEATLDAIAEEPTVS